MSARYEAFDLFLISLLACIFNFFHLAIPLSVPRCFSLRSFLYPTPPRSSHLPSLLSIKIRRMLPRFYPSPGWLRFTLASGFRVRGLSINPGTPGFPYLFHPHRSMEVSALRRGCGSMPRACLVLSCLVLSCLMDLSTGSIAFFCFSLPALLLLLIVYSFILLAWPCSPISLSCSFT